MNYPGSFGPPSAWWRRLICRLAAFTPMGHLHYRHVDSRGVHALVCTFCWRIEDYQLLKGPCLQHIVYGSSPSMGRTLERVKVADVMLWVKTAGGQA